MTEYEDLLLTTLEAGYDLVVSLDSIQVFGVGLWTWLLVFFVADFCIGVIFWFIAGRGSGTEGGDKK